MGSITLKLLPALVLLSVVSGRAVVYDFLPVTLTGTNTAVFTSQNGYGTISAKTDGTLPIQFNNTVENSKFTNLFLPSGVVQGWLTRYDNNAVYTNVFDLTGYALSTNTIFGIWNITQESNTYQLKLFAGNTQVAPVFTWNFIGYDDNFLDVQGKSHMNLNYTSGFFEPTNFRTSGVDCDGAFWDRIPTNTTRIVLTGVLNPTNMDGVAFYFAEPKRPCTIICPSNIVVTICGPTGTNVTFPLPTLVGDCGSNATVNCDPVSGSFFALGTNNVVCSVSGAPTNSSCSFTVTVLKTDPIPPVINCPTNDIVVFTCSNSAFVSYTVSATDNSGTVVSTNCSPSSGSAFPVGTNAVLCTAIDACSNATTCSFYIIVKQYLPTFGLICPNESLTVNVTGCPPVMPSLTNLVTITNQCPIPGGLIITQSPPAGATLPPGNQQVTIAVCPTNGSCQYCLLMVSAHLSSNCCLTQTFLNLFSGATNGSLLAGGTLDRQFSTGPPAFTTLNPYVPSSIHPLWLTNGPSSQWIGPVPGFTSSPQGVYPFTNRFFLCSTNQAAISGQWTLDDGGVIWLNGLPTSVMINTPAPNQSWHPVSINSGFVPGWNTMVFFVTNVVSSVTGLRTEIIGTGCCVPNCLSITCPTNMTVGTCFGSSQVFYSAPAVTSSCGTIASIQCTPPPGSYFPLGTNVVQCTVIDSAGNAATCSFTIRVVSVITPQCSANLSINSMAGTVTICWPQGVNGVELQGATNLHAPIQWDTVTTPAQDTNSSTCVTLPLQGPLKFFRLGPQSPGGPGNP